ncbi:MAG: hypothetical protein KY393_01605 [Actinobacteria bacterium]|nr:hypothetical protein [Actinomycetota bacterium]
MSILFRIKGDPEHPFSEAVGVLQRIDSDPTTYHVLRRSGEVVEVPEQSVVTLKLMPAARGPLRRPKSWSKTPESPE